jgi:CRP-like cAMP-binding protein
VKGLTRIGLFEGMSDEELDALAARAHLRSFPANTVIVKEGEPADSLYIVLSGSVKVCLYEGDREVVLDTKGSGQYFGEMMLDDKPRSASVVSVEPAQFAVISRADFKALMLKHPNVAVQVVRNLIHVARDMNVKTRHEVRTHENLRRRIEDLEATKVQDVPAVKRWRYAKHWVLAAVLVFAVLQYYFLDVFLQVVSMNGLTVFVH